MIFRPATLLLLLSLFVLSANSAWACGSDKAGHAVKSQRESSEKSCCSQDKAQTPCADDAERQQQSGAGCPCDHENGGCHCPGCGMVCSSGAAFMLAMFPAPGTSSVHITVQTMAFYFADHLPEAVYLPIWQPPKLVA